MRKILVYLFAINYFVLNAQNGGTLVLDTFKVQAVGNTTISGVNTGNQPTTYTLCCAVTGSGTVGDTAVISLGSFTSYDLSNALIDETGTGSAVFRTNPVLIGSDNSSSTYALRVHNSTGVSNSLMIRNDGNIAMGKIPSTFKLDVSGSLILGSGASDPSLSFRPTSGGITSIKYTVGRGFIINSQTTDSIYFSSGGGTPYVVFSGGNKRVGIGLLSPTERLDVMGNIKASGNIVFGTNQSKINSIKITIDSTQSRSLFTSPITAIPAPGAGYKIKIISASIRYNYGTITYANSTNIILTTNTATYGQCSVPIFQCTNSVDWSFVPIQPSCSGTQLIENQSVKITCDLANAINGNGSFDVYILYEWVKL